MHRTQIIINKTFDTRSLNKAKSTSYFPWKDERENFRLAFQQNVVNFPSRTNTLSASPIKDVHMYCNKNSGERRGKQESIINKYMKMQNDFMREIKLIKENKVIALKKIMVS